MTATTTPQVVYASTTRSKYVHVLRGSGGGAPHGPGIRLRYACGGEAFAFPHGPARMGPSGRYTSTGFRGHMVVKFQALPAGAVFCPKCEAKAEATVMCQRVSSPA